ncbi:hypothetical protein [Sporomusa malonica]|uniref:Uncharacterized protein n=1 Tax=Sporomusa malonica TaxID=112901 RepID=A0A1W2DRL4_9FIRM|nr:hypothetical protein [Sporomusa malonica]SMC99768.1 hypothetical protein SAMN04488500_11795 [Sporomusa malonica]
MQNMDGQPKAERQEQPPSSRSKRLKERVVQSSNEETIAGLEQVFEAKLAAVQSYERRMSTITDPYALKALRQMIEQERRELMSLAELIELVEVSPDMGGVGRLNRQFNHRVKSSTGRTPGFWLAAALVGAVLVPSVRETLRPLVLKTVQGVMELGEQAQGLFSGVKEDLEDLMAEAQFDKFKQSIEASFDELPVDGGIDNPDLTQ